MSQTTSKAPPFRFNVPILRSHSGYLPWIIANKAGVEIQDLLRSELAPDPEELGRFWAKLLKGEAIDVSFHGPKDPPVPLDRAPDREIPPAFLGALDLAVRIGAGFFIVHPQLGSRREGDLDPPFIEAWRRLAEGAEARRLKVLLENTDEDRPDALVSLLKAAGSPSLGLCLDVGHARLHSAQGLESWLDAFGDSLLYVHLYNSSGADGSHRALGDGEIDIEGFLGLLARDRSGVRICLEMDVPQILSSASWLEARGILKLRSKAEEDPFGMPSF